VQACFSSFSSLSGFMALNAGPIVVAHSSIRWAFSGYCLLIVAVCVPLLFLMHSWMGIYKVEDKHSSCFGGSGSEEELSETTPLKRVVVQQPSR
jgi:hypothetical protein